MRCVPLKLSFPRAKNLDISLVSRNASSLMAIDSYSPRSILQAALHSAKNAVFFDNRHNYGDAIGAYRDACELLRQVMKVNLGEEDKAKMEAIVHESLNDSQQSDG